MGKSFIFGGDTPWTYEQLQRQRDMATALAANLGTPRNVGEGLASVGKALAIRGINRRADKEQGRLQSEADALAAKAFGGFGGGAGAGGGTAMYGAPAKVAPPSGATGIVATPATENPGGLDPSIIAAVDKVAPNSPKPLDASEIPTRLMADLSRDLNLSPEQAAGVVGNLAAETGGFRHMQEINPMVPGSRGGFGFAQWTGPRRVAFEKYAQENGLAPNSYEANYGFLKHELQNTPEGAVLDPLRQAQDPASAARVFSEQFLRPGIPNMGARTGYAEQFAGDTRTAGGGIRTADASGGYDIGTLAAVIGNPLVSPEQRAVAQVLIDQQLSAMDPMNALELREKQLQVDALENPATAKEAGKPPQVETFYDEKTGQQYKAQWYGQQWVPVGGVQAPDGPLVNIEGDAPQIPPDEEALRGALGKKEGEAWSAYMDSATVSAGAMQDFEFIDELITMAPQGPIQGRLAGAFPGMNSAADAFTSVVKRVAPTLRAPGSGATSDIEYEGMVKSLPQLSSRPEANRAISAMMKAKAQINIERGQIIARYQNSEMSAPDARKALTELNSRSIMTPELKAILGQTAPPQPGSDITEEDAAYLRSLGIEP